MTGADAFALPHSDLNSFLFADVGVDASGMPLSVLSALARLGMDPWQEARRLAKLPQTAAVEGLARMIASMPASLWPLADATTIARRLVALLPGAAQPAAAPLSAKAARTWTMLHWAASLALLAALLASALISRTSPPVENDLAAPFVPSLAQPTQPAPAQPARVPTGE